MNQYEVRLQGREEVAEGTLAFRFDKPAGFVFKAGQAIDLVLPGDEALRHTFSLACAPAEPALAIATRMRDSAYKRALGALAPGAVLRLEGPSGSLTLHGDRGRAAVFIAGGIGITPFIGMLRQAAQEGSPQRRVLLYSNRRPEDAAFLDELQGLAASDGPFRLIATMTKMHQSARPWSGARGAIDAALLRRVGAELAHPVWYVAGPPGMVEEMRETLGEAGASDDDIRSEEFYGY